MRVSTKLFAIASSAVITLPTLVALEVRSPVLAQDDACYMVNSSGKRVNLGKLCRGGSAQPTSRAYSLARIKRRDGGTPVIDVTFNGNRTYEMLLDTGASGTLITRSMAQALNIPIVGASRFTMADGRNIIMPVGRITSMTVDGATVRNVNVAIANDSAEGLLGSDFLANYDIKIKRDVVEFYPR